MDCPSFSVLEFGVFDSEVKFPKMVTTQDRRPDCYELELYAADCPGKSCMDGQWYPLLHGTFVCAKPTSIRKSFLPFKCYYIHLQTEDAALQQLLDGIPALFTLPRVQELVHLWNQLLPLDPENFPEDRLLLTSGVCRIIHTVCHYRHAASDIKEDRILLHQKSLLQTEAYIRSHLSEPLELQQLAAVCGLSPTYFHSVFTEFFQKTPARFVLDCRITAAKTALLTENRDLAELAADCGFSSQSYFCYKFKQVTGQSPLQYRKDQLGKLQL
ncbi:MAG: helix-turn-helix transcriptional regulator [Oscillospiraceae bacterium]|nr:helix-turn-helix transcriptional regulator [Oscillospiraceae bacterium]